MHVLLVISGSVAAYKSLELIRLLVKRGDTVDAVLTKGGAEFITALSVSSLTGRQTYTDLFSLKDETEMGHIRLTRDAEVVLVAPASADFIAKMAGGRASDLATATLLASDKPVHVAPAMNARMWDHPATQRNLKQIEVDGARIVMPDAGQLACGEVGPGRMAEPAEILAFIAARGTRELRGKRVVMTAGPTQEPLDPVRFLGNRSSGKQGYAIAECLAEKGAEVILVSGPVAMDAPHGVKRLLIETAAEMQDAVMNALPADVFIGAAAVADWRPRENSVQKIKKLGEAPVISLIQNPDILAEVSRHRSRPELVIGFAAETEDLIENASRKRLKKGCDWMLANSAEGGAVFGSDNTTIHLIDALGLEAWGGMNKREAAVKLCERIVRYFTHPTEKETAA